MLETYRGSCHCGAIAYEADIDLGQGTGKCNCTYCMKTRAWKSFVKPDAFRLIRGADTAVGYRRHPQASEKFHCPACGVHTHERGDADYMGGPFVGLFVASLDDVPAATFAAAPVRYADGLHDNWRAAPAETAYL